MTRLDVTPIDATTSQPIADYVIQVGIMDNGGQPAPCEPAIRKQNNFYISPNPYGSKAPYLVYGSARASGYKEQIFQQSWDGVTPLNITVPLPLGFRRPAAKQQSLLPDWDKSDSGGNVFSTPPSPWTTWNRRDPLVMLADFGGINLNADHWGGHQYFVDTFLQGANTTPYETLLSPMLIMYPRKLQDAWLTENGERNNNYIVIASDGWNFDRNGFSLTPQDFVKWALYCKSWGNFICYWSPLVMDDPYFAALLNAHAVDFNIVGEEVDSKVSAQQYQQHIENRLSMCGRGVPIGAHFTSNFPDGFPKDTFFDGRTMPGFDHYDGLVHLMWQADQRDSAGTQGARLYYARRRVNLGTVAGSGNPAPNSRVYAYETMTSAQFQASAWTPPRPDSKNQYGTCTEEYANLRNLELTYTTVLPGEEGIRPIAGVGSGVRQKDGWWLGKDQGQ